MIQQLFPLLLQHPLLPKKVPLPQILKRIRIQMMLQQQLSPPKIDLPQLLSHPLSHPHPQFVAVKSLMINPP